MKPLHRIFLLIVWVMMSSVRIGRADDFYETRLHSGAEAYRQKRIPEAIDQLRIASFGFLDNPALLSESLARLALAQAAAGRTADAEATLQRLIAVERQFSSFSQVKLEPNVRGEFQTLLTTHISATTLKSFPAFAGLIENEEEKLAKLPPKERRKALEAAAQREPGNAAWPVALAREAAGRQDNKAVVEWTGRALEISPGNADALALRAHARVQRRDCAGALADLKNLPPAEITSRPELAADQFVCLVETKDWAAAEAAAKRVPANDAARSDVAQAQRELSAHTSESKSAAGSATTTAPGSAAPSRTNPNPSGTAAKPAPSNPGQTDASAGTAGKAAPSNTAQANPSAGSAKPTPSSTTQTNPTAASAGKSASTGNPPVPQPSGPAPTPTIASAANARTVPARTSADSLAEARRLVKARKAAEAEALLLEAVKSDPENRDLRLSLLEASCLNGDWNRALDQLPRVSPLAESEAPSMFYVSVALYETGRTEEAKGFLKRSVSKVSGPLVDEYSKKILGRP